MKIFDVLYYIALLLGAFPIVLFKRRTKSNSHHHYPIEPFLWLGLFSSLYEYVGTTLLEISSIFWFKLYTFLEFFTVTYFFYYLLQKKFKLFFGIFSAIFIIMFLYIMLHFGEMADFKADTYLSIVEIIVVYFYTIVWLKKVFVDTSEKDLLENPDFYFIVGIVLYLSGTFFMTLLAELIYKNVELSLDEFWISVLIFNIILRLLLILGIWKIPQK